MNSYARFGVMIATSTMVMFGLTYLNTYQLDHVFFSETRAYMALVMGAAMAVIMLTFMPAMYPNRRAKAGILAASTALFVVALWLVRSQATVADVAWMKAMIPHHSIAILTSERAHITDPRVRALADGIIKTQRQEIDEMKALIRDLENPMIRARPGSTSIGSGRSSVSVTVRLLDALGDIAWCITREPDRSAREHAGLIMQDSREVRLAKADRTMVEARHRAALAALQRAPA